MKVTCSTFKIQTGKCVKAHLLLLFNPENVEGPMRPIFTFENSKKRKKLFEVVQKCGI